MTSPRLRYNQSLPANALKYTNIHDAIQGVVLIAVIAGLVWWLVPDPWKMWILIALPALLILSLLIEMPIVNRLAIKNTSYEVSESEVRIRKGVLLTRDTVISAAQILNVSIAEGPILKSFGLAKVNFTSIAHVEPLGPVTLAEANDIRNTILGVYSQSIPERETVDA